MSRALTLTKAIAKNSVFSRMAPIIKTRLVFSDSVKVSLNLEDHVVEACALYAELEIFQKVLAHRSLPHAINKQSTAIMDPACFYGEQSRIKQLGLDARRGIMGYWNDMQIYMPAADHVETNRELRPEPYSFFCVRTAIERKAWRAEGNLLTYSLDVYI